jgi:hypothetical protein
MIADMLSTPLLLNTYEKPVLKTKKDRSYDSNSAGVFYLIVIVIEIMSEDFSSC